MVFSVLGTGYYSESYLDLYLSEKVPLHYILSPYRNEWEDDLFLYY